MANERPIMEQPHFTRRVLLARAVILAASTVARRRERWIRPATDSDPPIWGIRGGVQFGISPASIEGSGVGGPRGLLRVGYPILDAGRRPGLVNFLAIEPIVAGKRAYSELERSPSDGRAGIRLRVQSAVTGEIRESGRALKLTVATERFRNGAEPILDLEIRASAPGELRITTRAAPDSAPMETCIVTATMGNYMRLRQLWLKDRVVGPSEIWPDFRGEEFTPDAFFGADRLVTTPSGSLLVCATTNERDPHSVPPDPAGPSWAYRGSFPLTQYWRVERGGWSDRLRVRVNARERYWATHNPVPGGLAFENFELQDLFRPGQTFIYGLTRSSPRKLAHSRFL